MIQSEQQATPAPTPAPVQRMAEHSNDMGLGMIGGDAESLEGIGALKGTCEGMCPFKEQQNRTAHPLEKAQGTY